MVKNSRKNNPVTIIGYVDYIDEDDPEAGVVIITEEDEVYRVEPNKQGRRLLSLIDEPIHKRVGSPIRNSEFRKLRIASS